MNQPKLPSSATLCLTRAAWLLFSDANTRFNLLTDECAHLQDTIFGFLEETTNKHLGTEHALPDTKERAWMCPNPRHASYYRLSNQERTLINLWNTVGSLAHGLDANRQELNRRFRRVLRALRSDSDDIGEYYWFVAQRGYFLHLAFDFYTRKISHAHEKIVQLLENMPGALPNPLLLRRWSSAAYGEFLSEYSRHVNWQTQLSIWTLIHNTNQNPAEFERFEEWRKAGFLTHIWAHSPTSQAQKHTIPLKTEAGVRPGRFGSIWSTFFYLEQPILFPLLYHECAHLNLDALLRDPPDSEGGSMPRNEKRMARFLAAREEAAETLRLTVKFESSNANVWREFIDEVWADTISISLGGTGYLAALYLQLFGISGVSAFSQFDTENDEIVDLTELGTRSREVREVPYLLGEEPEFWEARLRIAVEITEALHGASQWTLAVKASLTHWFSNGAIVHAAERSSRLHETFWHYRTELSGFIVDICMRCLQRCQKELKQFANIESLYVLKEQGITSLIVQAVKGYQTQILNPLLEATGVQASDLELDSATRLEDLSFLVRWHLSEAVSRYLLALDESEDIRSFLQAYATYMRNDGSSAFRLGFEWCTAKKELYDASADLVGLSQDDAHSDASQIMQCLKNGVTLDEAVAIKRWLGSRKCHEIDRSRLCNEFAIWLRRKQYSTHDRYLPKTTRFDVHNTTKAVTAALREVEKFLCSASPAGQQIRVGTLYLGVLRPWDISASSSDPSPYRSTLYRIRDYFQLGLTILKEKTSVFEKADFRSSFLPLVGDYSFINYVFGATPAERDSHPAGTPKFLTKPRLVLEVFRGGQSALEQLDSCGSLRKPSNCPYGRISLLRFRYRWQWVDLLKLLQLNQHRFHPVLFLSSGWEDAILITWHESETDYWASVDELGIFSTEDIDCQSNVILPELLVSTPGSASKVLFSKPDGGVAPEQGKGSSRHSWARAISAGQYSIVGGVGNAHVTAQVNARSGRYDYTVVWKGRPASPPPESPYVPGECGLSDFGEILSSLPDWYWKRIRMMSTSYELSVSQSECCKPNRTIVSHLLLRS